MRERGGPPAAREELVNAFWFGPTLSLVNRLPDGSVTIRRRRSEHACFLRASEVPRDMLRELRGERSVVGIAEEGEWLRVRWATRWHCMEACRRGGYFETNGVEAFEADVDPVRRFLTDNPVEIARPRRVYLDIEADSRIVATDRDAARMLSWALVDDESAAEDDVHVECEHGLRRERCSSCKKRGSNGRVVSRGRGGVVASGVLREDTDAAERELIEELWRHLARYDQIVAWAGDFFDFPYLKARTERRRIPIEFRRWLWLDQMTLFRRMNMSAAKSGDEKQSLKLDDVGRSVCGVGKLEGASGSRTWELWCEDPSLLDAYNRRDAVLQQLIEGRTGFVELLLTLCQSTFVFPDSFGIRPTQQVEGFMLRLGAARGLRFSTHHFVENVTKFEGAYVMDPDVRGVANDVHVCDFARLYPSVILSFNASPETLRGKLPNTPGRAALAAKRPSYLAHLPPEQAAALASPDPPPPDGCCAVPITRCVFANEPRGVLAVALEEMLRLRKEWDKKKASLPPGTPEWEEANRRSAAYKIAANSFYGVVGSPLSRFFLREVAESTAQGGVWLIKETIAAARARGLRVIYGDTDSAFAIGCSREEFRAFVSWCNAELYPRLLRERGCVRNAICLEFEKGFRRAVFVTKKRYAASYSHFKGTDASADSELEVKGLEYKRGDTARLARRMQLDVVEMLLRDDVDEPREYEALLDRYRDLILAGDLELQDVVISKRLTHAVGQYARKMKKSGDGYAAQPTHVEVARVMQERGDDVQKGARIEFVVIDGGRRPIVAVPAVDYERSRTEPLVEGEKRLEADRHYLWEQLVYPPTQRVLEAAFPDHDWTRWAVTRPPRPRVRRSKVLAGQMAFGFA